MTVFHAKGQRHGEKSHDRQRLWQHCALSLPYLLSYFLQTLYGMADLFIIGQYEGVASTTAVSIGSQVMHMLTVMIVGLAMGATVTIGQAVGARDRRGAAGYIGNTTTLFLALSVVVTGCCWRSRGRSRRSCPRRPRPCPARSPTCASAFSACH